MVQVLRPDPFARAGQEARHGNRRTPASTSTVRPKEAPLNPVGPPDPDADTSFDAQQAPQRRLTGIPQALRDADAPIKDRPLGRPYETFSQLLDREAIEQELELLNGRMQALGRQMFERRRALGAQKAFVARHPELSGEVAEANAEGLHQQMLALKARADQLQEKYHELQRDIRRNRRKYTGRPAHLI